jgi:hypothetical protein
MPNFRFQIHTHQKTESTPRREYPLVKFSSSNMLYNSKKDESYYRGEKKYGLKDGIGSMRTPKGDYYVGQWKRGLRHGLGKLILKEEGETYLCEWKFDNPHGLGEMTTKEGKKYQGEFKLAVPDGFGIKTWPDGSTYKGQGESR